MFTHSCLGSVLLISLLASPAWGDGPVLSLESAIEAALHAGDIDAQRQRVEEARGRLQQRTARPNPTLTYDRQDVFDAGAAPGFVRIW